MKIRFTWKLTLEAAPDRLWRYVADTNRLNQYAGLPEFTFHYVPEPDGGSRQIGETRYMGWGLQWEEHPFEWIEGRYFKVIRSYLNGPMREFRTSVRLTPRGEGTFLEQTLECEPRWIIALPAIWWEIGVTSKRRFVAAYRKIDQFLKGESDSPLAPMVRQAIPAGRVDIIRARLETAAAAPHLPRLIQDIETLDDEALDQMRPFVFADRWRTDRREVLKLFLHASQAGLLDLSWDVLCPGCRGASERHRTLRNLRAQAHCPACNIKYDADFADRVEITFRPNPLIRRVEVLRYCSGGPMNSPHTVLQQNIEPGESRTLQLRLSPWKYHVRSLKLSSETYLRTDTGSDRPEASITIQRPMLEPGSLDVRPDFVLAIHNKDDKPITVSLERVAGRENAATAAMVIAMQEFRTLFSAEVLAPETPISVGAVTLLFTDLKSSTAMYESLGEAPAYVLVQRHFDLLREVISMANGAIVKTIGDAVMAVFLDPGHAVEAAFEMHNAILKDNANRGEPHLTLKIGIHHGPCITVNQNDVLDYFGTTANLAARLQRESEGNDIVISEDVWQDPAVQQVLQKRGCQPRTRECLVRGLSGPRKVYVLNAGPDREAARSANGENGT
jgi:adenylate cyclase